MVKLRLARAGAKKRPFYRVVAVDGRFPRDGRFLEKLGTYDPTTNPSSVRLNHERVEFWLARGAKPTKTVAQLLRKERAAAAAAAAAG